MWEMDCPTEVETAQQNRILIIDLGRFSEVRQLLKRLACCESRNPALRKDREVAIVWDADEGIAGTLLSCHYFIVWTQPFNNNGN